MQKGRRDLAILAVVLVAAALLADRLLGSRGENPRHDVGDDVAACREHQRTLHRALVAYAAEHGGLPAADGLASSVQLLGLLFTSGTLSDTPENRALLACPGPGAAPIATDASPTNAASFGPRHTGYAVRDLGAHPLPGYPTGGEQPFLACDQANGGNHEGVLNVLYADGSVRTLLVEQLVERGEVPSDTTALRLGPDAEYAPLRVFPSGED